MCVVSNMGDIGGGMWPKPAPWGMPLKTWVPGPNQTVAVTPSTFPTREQFEAFDALLRAAMKFDEATGQKECETAAKTAWIKGFYDHFGLKCPL
jgi:hypothetical protein